MTEHDDRSEGGERFVVSGIELEVTNPALAALLSDVRIASGQVEQVRLDHRTVAEAAPGAMIAVPSPRGQAEERARQQLRARVAAAGEALGFEVGSEGTWRSETGVTILTRVSERQLTPAAAVYFVTEIVRGARRDHERGAVLFVVGHAATAEAFTVAIRHRRAGDVVRTITIEDLERLGALCAGGRVTHDDAVAILAPIGGIDVGPVVRAIARAHSPEEG